MWLKMAKKPVETVEFDINALFGLTILIGIIALSASYILSSLSDVKGDLCTYSYNATEGICVNSTGGIGDVGDTSAVNATNSGMEGIAKIPTKLPLIVGIVLIVVIIALFKRFGDSA